MTALLLMPCKHDRSPPCGCLLSFSWCTLKPKKPLQKSFLPKILSSLWLRRRLELNHHHPPLLGKKIPHKCQAATAQTVCYHFDVALGAEMSRGTEMRQGTYLYQKELEGITLMFSVVPRAKETWSIPLQRLPVIPTQSLNQTLFGDDSIALTSAWESDPQLIS